MWIKACLNGVRTPDEHPAIPVTPDQLAAAALGARDAGARAVHLHPKDADGRDTFDAAVTAAAVTAVRSAAPGLPVGVTTGAWALPDPQARVEAVRAWTTLPDFASVNWHEDGAEQVTAGLLERGVAVEAGLWHAEAVRSWLASPTRARTLRVLVELPDGPNAEGSVAEADRLLGLLAGIDLPIVLHGLGSSCWPTLRHALDLELPTRVGLEDTLVRPDGTPAPDNATLIADAVALAVDHQD